MTERIRIPPVATAADLKVLAVVPARKNSSRFPGKNFHPIAGRPCIEYTIQHLAECKSQVTTMIVSDDPRALEVLARYEKSGARFLHVPEPPELAREFDLFKVLRYACYCAASASISYHAVLRALPNVPVRPPGVFDRLVNCLLASKSAWVSVVTRPRDHPYRMYHRLSTGQVAPLCLGEMRVPSENFPPVWMDTGAGRIYTKAALKRIFADRTCLWTSPHATIACDYDEVVELDVPADAEWAEFLLQREKTPE